MTQKRGAPRARERGFTIHELLIVITLIGLSASLSVNSLLGYRASQRTRAGAILVRSALNMAKGRAAAINGVARVDFSPGPLSTSEGFFVVYLDLDLDGAMDPGEAEAAALPDRQRLQGMIGFQLPPSMRFEQPGAASVGPLGIPVVADGVTFTNDELAFYPDGTAAESGHLTIVDKSQRTYAVTVTVGGAVRIYNPDGSGWK